MNDEQLGQVQGQEPEPKTVRSPATGLVTSSGFRIDGSSQAPPWNYPEPELVDWMQHSPIELLDEQMLSGAAGTFLAWIRQEGLRGVLVRFAGVGRKHALDNWSAEYSLESANDLLTREVVAYEWVKGMGGEDLAAPVCIRDLDTVDLISDAVRDRLAKQERISPHDVDAKLGIAATLQLLPRNMVNFAEYWSTLGIDNEERWAAASEQLRFSLYRAYFMDFVLGTADRTISALMYNVTTDRLFVPDYSCSFPHVGFTAEKYLQMRVAGWDGLPGSDSCPSTMDFRWLFETLTTEHLGEAVMVAQQLTARVGDELATQMMMVGMEFGVPVKCLAGSLLRLAYVSTSPGSVLKRPIEFVRNLCVPIRQGMAITAPKIASNVEYVNQVVSTVMGEPFDLLEVIMAPEPEGSAFVV